MHLVGELFTRQSGADIVHIPYKGTVPALAALLARDVDASFAGVPDSLPYVEAGKLRALAVAGSSRSPLVPNVPTMAEAGVDGVQAIIWYGILAPAGTPRDVVDALARAVNAASNAPQYRQSLAAMGIEPSPGTPAAFGALLRNDVAKYGAIIRDAHIHAE